MKFNCEELTITDDRDFACTILFSDTRGFNAADWPRDENVKYLMIQRLYPEDFDETDFYQIETSEEEEELGLKDNIIIDFKTNMIKIRWSWVEVEIGLDLDDKEIQRLKRILKSRFKKKVILIEE